VYLRYMAATDDSPASSVAWQFLGPLLQVAARARIALRLVSVSGGEICGRWRSALDLLASDMQGAMVNVVCCDPSRWTWVQRCAMPNPDGTSSHALERMGLYTAGAHNVLIAHTAQVTPEQRQAALAYEVLVAPTYTLADAWLPACVHVIPPTDAGANELRDVLRIPPESPHGWSGAPRPDVQPPTDVTGDADHERCGNPQYRPSAQRVDGEPAPEPASERAHHQGGHQDA
jgi:hypothetical protein